MGRGREVSKKKAKQFEKVIELSPRERQYLRGILANEAQTCLRVAQGVELPSISAGIQQSAMMADRLHAKFFDPLDDTSLLYKVSLLQYKEIK